MAMVSQLSVTTQTNDAMDGTGNGSPSRNCTGFDLVSPMSESVCLKFKGIKSESAAEYKLIPLVKSSALPIGTKDLVCPGLNVGEVEFSSYKSSSPTLETGADDCPEEEPKMGNVQTQLNNIVKKSTEITLSDPPRSLSPEPNVLVGPAVQATRPTRHNGLLKHLMQAPFPVTKQDRTMMASAHQRI